MEADSEEQKCLDQRDKAAILRAKNNSLWSYSGLSLLRNLDLFRTLQRLPWKLEAHELAKY